MPTVAQIEQALFQLAPKDLAFDWDNVGHLEGQPQSRGPAGAGGAGRDGECGLRKRKSWAAQLIVSHHPLMNVRWHQAEVQTRGPTAIWAVCCGDW